MSAQLQSCKTAYTASGCAPHTLRSQPVCPISQFQAGCGCSRNTLPFPCLSTGKSFVALWGRIFTSANDSKALCWTLDLNSALGRHSLEGGYCFVRCWPVLSIGVSTTGWQPRACTEFWCGDRQRFIDSRRLRRDLGHQCQFLFHRESHRKYP